jgi:arginine decarboxylase
MTTEKQISVNPLVPKAVFLTRGVGVHSERLNSFEEALRDARISSLNLVTVSSIVPPNCRLLDIDQGLEQLSPGQLTFSVMSRCDCNEEGRLMTAAVAILLPENPDDYGYISEFHGYGMEAEEVEDWVCDQAAELYASAKGLKINWKRAWSPEAEKYTLAERSFSPKYVVSMARGKKEKWVTTVAAAVFIL